VVLSTKSLVGVFIVSFFSFLRDGVPSNCMLDVHFLFTLGNDKLSALAGEAKSNIKALSVLLTSFVQDLETIVLFQQSCY